jgi:Flp pilus assembly protein TadG
MAKAVRPRRANERGGLLIYFAVLLLPILFGTGITIELGRAYLIKANLSKAVDAAALAAAQAIGDGPAAARDAASRIFAANFPNGYLGAASVQSPPTVTITTGADSSNIITVTSSATLANHFAGLVGLPQYTLAGRGQTTRRAVDVSFVIDHSGSLNSVWSEVQAASQQFVRYFDPNVDRMALILFSGSTTLMDTMGNARGFKRDDIIAHIGTTGSSGYTATAEGLYQGWDQLRMVDTGGQSSMRIIVLFTDGAPNTFSAQFSVNGGSPLHGAMYTGDFPYVGGSSSDSTEVSGLFKVLDPSTGWSFVKGPVSSPTDYGPNWDTQKNASIPWIPLQSFHTHSSTGIPSAFDLFDPKLSGQRPLDVTASGYPSTVKNANNAARNLAEKIAHEARTDLSGAFTIKIFTLGLGDLLNQPMGTAKETGSSMLKRIANDKSSPDYDAGQPEGKYYFAGNTAELAAAFEAVRNQVIRFSE